MSYELEKELGIQRAYVAELEAKNRRLREIASASDNKRGDLEELLKVQQVIYEAKVKKLYTEISEGNRRSVEALKIMKADEVKYKALQESHITLVNELNETIAEQSTVIQELTDDLSAVTQENTGLRDRISSLQRRGQAFEKLEKVLEQFE